MPRHEILIPATDAPSGGWLARAWGAVTRSFTIGPYSTSSGDKALKDLFGGPPSVAGPAVTAESAVTITAVTAAVNLIAGAITSLPLVVYRREDSGKARDDDHRVSRLLRGAPNPDQNAVAFREAMLVNLLLRGICYGEITRDGVGRPAGLHLLEPSRVEPISVADGRTRIAYAVRTDAAGEVVLPGRDVLAILGPGSTDGVTPADPIRRLRSALGIGLALEQFAGLFFAQGANPRGVLAHPGRLSDGAHQRLQRVMEDSLGGLQRAHRLAILEEGISWHPVSLDPEKSQVLESRKHLVEEIARFYNVPPHLIGGDRQGLTYSNVETENARFLQQTLLPWLRRIECELNQKLFDPQEERFVEHLVDGLLRASSEARWAAYKVAVELGVMTTDEVRERENLPQRAGGPGPTSAAAPRAAVSIAIERQLAQDAMRRMVHREALKARQASTSPERLRAWMATFYTNRRPMVDMLTPVLELHGTLVRSAVAPAERAAALVDAHCTESITQLEDALGDATGPGLEAAVAAITARWEADRPPALADRLQHEVLGHGHRNGSG